MATVHRAENTDDPQRLRAILTGLTAAKHPVILPLHPRTKTRIQQYGIDVGKQIVIVSPVGYLEMIWLEANAALIATESGGVQKEAYFYKKYCITLRDETEWVELVKSGWNVIAGANSEQIGIHLCESSIPQTMTPLFSRGDAAEKTANLLR